MGLTMTAQRRAEGASAQASPDWRRYRELVIVTTVRSLKVRYRGSILGIYWSLSNPLLMTGIYTAIFGTAFARYYGGSIFNYVLAVFTGLAVLNFFSQSTSMALPSIVGNGALLNKIALPPSIFPVAQIAAATFQMCVGTLPLLMIVALATSHNPLNVIAVLVPGIALMLLSLGFAFAVAAGFVYFRDLIYMYELVVFVIYFTSPIFYPAAIVPDGVRKYMVLNPLSNIIESVRQIVLSGMRPSLHLMGYALLSGAIAAAIGGGIYASCRRGFMDLL
jgi:ABC-type polysaccharide/polyol phosphate export permease